MYFTWISWAESMNPVHDRYTHCVFTTWFTLCGNCVCLSITALQLAYQQPAWSPHNSEYWSRAMKTRFICQSAVLIIYFASNIDRSRLCASETRQDRCSTANINCRLKQMSISYTGNCLKHVRVLRVRPQRNVCTRAPIYATAKLLLAICRVAVTTGDF